MDDRKRTSLTRFLILLLLLAMAADHFGWIDLDSIVQSNGNQVYDEPVGNVEPVNPGITVVRATQPSQVQVIVVEVTSEPVPTFTPVPVPTLVPTPMPTRTKATTTTQIGEERPTSFIDAVDDGLHNLWYSITH